MNEVLGAALAVLIYPGLVVAAIAAVTLMWAREAVAATVQRIPATGPVRYVEGYVRAGQRPGTVSRGSLSGAITAALLVAFVCPILALLFLPVPGNPLINNGLLTEPAGAGLVSRGLTGDLLVVAALLFGQPLARIFLGWISPSATTRIAADRGARLLAGAAVAVALATTAMAQQLDSLRLDGVLSSASSVGVAQIARVLAAGACACALPVLARRTSMRRAEEGTTDLYDEAADLSGRDLMLFRLSEALQMIAFAIFFGVVFVVPIFAHWIKGSAYLIALGIVALATALGLGLWDFFGTPPTESEDRPPLSWWLGVPVLLALAALVAASFASRIGTP
ncbi:MAG TPA: NADH-quinone oxidoreductase subunit H [Ktedonobacterales bacterium]